MKTFLNPKNACECHVKRPIAEKKSETIILILNNIVSLFFSAIGRLT